MLSDQELIDRVLQGDTHAFELLDESYEDPVRRHLLHIVSDDAAAVVSVVMIALGYFASSGGAKTR